MALKADRAEGESFVMRFNARAGSRMHAELARRAEVLDVSLNAYVISVLASHVGLAGSVPMTLADAIVLGSIAAEDAATLEAAVRERGRIAILGGPGSGKTRLLEMLAARRAGSDRRIVITDSDRSLLGTGEVDELHRCPESSFPTIIDEILKRPPESVFIDEARRSESIEAAMRLCRTSMHGHRIGGVAVFALRAGEDVVQRLAGISGSSEEEVRRTIDLIVSARRTEDGIRYGIATTAASGGDAA